MSDAQQSDDEVVRITPDTVEVRRAPKYGAFVVVGAMLGLIVTFILTSLFPVDESVGLTALLAYFSLYGITGGAVVGAVTAIVFDRASRRRTRSVAAERTRVEPGPITGDLEE